MTPVLGSSRMSAMVKGPDRQYAVAGSQCEHFLDHLDYAKS